MTTSNQKAQHPIAPPVAENVPQWCRDAAEEIYHWRGRAYSAIDSLAAIIARHAPKAVPQQGVPEIPPAAAVWPRYFEQRNCRGPYKRLRFESPTVCKWAYGHASHLNLSESMPKIFSMEAVLQTHIETDAEGNALPEKQEASGVESKPVQRFQHYGPYDIESVPAADHDRVVREKDATIAELRKRIVHLKKQRTLMEHKVIACGVAATHPNAKLAASGVYKTKWNSQQLEEVIALRTRAEAAEAKCAEYRNTFTAANEMRLSEVRLRHQVQQRADALTAQLAAANERVREAYAILCQLENVYRRQSTESVGSFGVSQEVHSLLKRAMDTLNGKEKQ